MKRLAVLGSTGSIGVNTLHIVRQFPDQFEVISSLQASTFDFSRNRSCSFGLNSSPFSIRR